MAGAIAVGGISDGVFNPQVGFGLATLGMITWATWGIYLLAQIAAGVAAGLVFRALNPTDK
jgi:aquaporin Z